MWRVKVPHTRSTGRVLPKLSALWQPWITPHLHGTKELTIPFARTETFLHSFVPCYSKLWNNLVKDTDIHRVPTFQKFKCGANNWFKE